MTVVSLYGIAAEFENPKFLVEAARAAHQRGYTKMEAYTPYPVRQLDDVIKGRRGLPAIVLAGGILGFFTAWAMEFYIAVFDYPTNIGGRPLNSWPSFIVIMFELTILFASISAFAGMLALCGFPRPNHPMFNLRRFSSASNNHFFLCIEAADPLFDREATADLLAQAQALEVWEIDED